MGDLDFVPGVLQDCGAQILFHKLAIKPGMPTLFARRPKGEPGRGGSPSADPRADRGRMSYIFGLPGNPVSVFVIFEVLVRPLLSRLLGLRHRVPTAAARLAFTVQRREAGRVEYRPVRLEGGEAQAIGYHGSSHLNALSDADALLRLDAGVQRLEEGTQVHVRLL